VRRRWPCLLWATVAVFLKVLEMPEVGQNVEHWRGNSLTIEIRVADKNGLPIDVTPVTAKWCVARSAQAKANGDLFVEKTNAPAGGITIDPHTDGFDYLTVTLRPADTEDLVPGNYYHEAEIVDESGNVFTVCLGKFRLQPAVLPPRST
jgi:hypothetical protein